MALEKGSTPQWTRTSTLRPWRNNEEGANPQTPIPWKHESQHDQLSDLKNTTPGEYAEKVTTRGPTRRP